MAFDVKASPTGSRDKPESAHDVVHVTVLLGGRCAPNRCARKALKDRPSHRQVCMSDDDCHKANMCEFFITLNLPTQPKPTSDVADVFSMARLHGVKVEV